MLVPAGMLPTLPVLSMLPSVRLRLSQRLKLMLLFCMEDMDMVVLDMLDLAMLVLDMAMLLLLLMATLVLDMPDMEDMVLDMDVESMARGLLMLSQRLMLVFCMEDMAMVVLGMLDLDMLVLDMDMLLLLPMATLVLDMPDMEDMVLDMAVEPTLVKHQMQKQKLKSNLVIQCPV